MVNDMPRQRIVLKLGNTDWFIEIEGSLVYADRTGKSSWPEPKDIPKIFPTARFVEVEGKVIYPDEMPKAFSG